MARAVELESRVGVVLIFFSLEFGIFGIERQKPRPVKYFVFGDCEWSEEEKTLPALQIIFLIKKVT